LATASAFDLILTEAGARLAYSPIDSTKSALVLQDLDAQGRTKGSPREVLKGGLAGAVSDLHASETSSGLALAWVSRFEREGRVQAAYYQDNGNSEPFDLGPALLGPRATRGNLAVASFGDHALVFARQAADACSEPGERECVGFGFHRVESDGARPTGLSLAVPSPCPEHSAKLAVVGSRWHYSVCRTEAGQKTTTLFSIQRSPEYARADTVLERCQPLSLLTLDGQVALVSDCGGSRKLARQPRWDHEPLTRSLGQLKFQCKASRAEIRGEGFQLALDRPQAELFALLPRLAKRNDRAVWTGQALLVASQQNRQLKLYSYSCAPQDQR
jgi:hypothetical protein